MLFIFLQIQSIDIMSEFDSCNKCASFVLPHLCIEHSSCITTGRRGGKYATYVPAGCEVCKSWLTKARAGDAASKKNLTALVRKIKDHRLRSHCPKERLLDFCTDPTVGEAFLQEIGFKERSSHQKGSPTRATRSSFTGKQHVWA